MFAELLENSRLKPVIYDHIIDYYRFRGLNPEDMYEGAAKLYRVLDEKRGMKKKKTQNPSVKKKFSFNEQREYDTIEDTIARKEAEIEQTETDINNSVSDFVKLNELTQKKEQLESELDQLLERYVYLTELAESFEKN